VTEDIHCIVILHFRDTFLFLFPELLTAAFTLLCYRRMRLKETPLKTSTADVIISDL